jgi:hypothetical protein
MVNIPIAGKLFTGVGTLLELTVMDQNGDAIPNVTVMESVNSKNDHTESRPGYFSEWHHYRFSR